jgi:hypothetical protein
MALLMLLFFQPASQDSRVLGGVLTESCMLDAAHPNLKPMSASSSPRTFRNTFDLIPVYWVSREIVSFRLTDAGECGGGAGVGFPEDGRGPLACPGGCPHRAAESRRICKQCKLLSSVFPFLIS